MKATGIVRRTDDLGRIVIPKDIRNQLRILEGDPLEVYVDNDCVIFKKYCPLSSIEDLGGIFAQPLAYVTGHTVLICSRDYVIEAVRVGNYSIQWEHRKLSKEVCQILELNEPFVPEHWDKNDIKICDDIDDAHPLYIYPICEVDYKISEVLGAIILVKDHPDDTLKDSDISATKVTGQMIRKMLPLG